ncbi:helix-turn-helix domain-containing protein [Leifsonia aquatica]|uniref:helix-turn-helix domain-containing protein n=1 Tax=Leifsonia aquatica TaxID=144185 RepID=UPI0013B35A28|nr:helix-turn-helix transcriptional regulator [Leifsonia aquatica]
MQIDEPQSVEQAFGRAVKAARNERGMSQRSLAEYLGRRGGRLDQSAIARIESGERAIRLDEAASLSEALDIDLEPIMWQFADPETIHSRNLELAEGAVNDARHNLWRAIELVRRADVFSTSQRDRWKFGEGLPAAFGDVALDNAKTGEGTWEPVHASTEEERKALQQLAFDIATEIVRVADGAP